MKAIRVQEDHDRTLTWEETADPVYTPHETLLNVHATALNRADLLQRAGRYPPPPGVSNVMGLEIAGCVAAIGDQVTGWNVGDRVCALLSGGGYAEQVAVPHQMLMPIPNGWSYEQATALPEVCLTVFVNFYMEAELQPGETVLVHGGASGVGTAAIKMAKITRNPIIVTAGTNEKITRCTELGAALAVNYKQESFVDRIYSYTNGVGVDVIMDTVGAAYLEQNLQLLKPQGRLISIGLLSGGRTEINLGMLMSRRLHIIGSVLRSRSLDEKIEIVRKFMDVFWPHVLKGNLRPIIDSVYPISRVHAAQQRMIENRNIGKIVLTVR